MVINDNKTLFLDRSNLLCMVHAFIDIHRATPRLPSGHTSWRALKRVLRLWMYRLIRVFRVTSNDVLSSLSDTRIALYQASAKDGTNRDATYRGIVSWVCGQVSLDSACDHAIICLASGLNSQWKLHIRIILTLWSSFLEGILIGWKVNVASAGVTPPMAHHSCDTVPVILYHRGLLVSLQKSRGFLNSI